MWKKNKERTFLLFHFSQYLTLFCRPNGEELQAVSSKIILIDLARDLSQRITQDAEVASVAAASCPSFLRRCHLFQVPESYS